MSEVTSPPDGPKAAVHRRWLLPALVVSLALNLLVVGMIVADHMRPPPKGRITGPSFSEILPRSFFRELPEARRAEFRKVFQQNRQAFREDRQALRDSALAVAASLSAQPFDDAAVQSAIDAYGSRSRELVDLGMGIAKQVVVGLTPEERQSLAKYIRERAEMRRSKREGKEPRESPDGPPKDADE